LRCWVICCFFATSVNSSCWRWISCFMGTNATCVFFVAHKLPRLILGSWCCSFVLQVLCVVNVIQPLPMLLVCGASIDYVCCRCYLSTSNIILCATSAINVTLALPMVFKEFQVLLVVLTHFQWCLGIVRAFWHAIRCCQCFSCTCWCKFRHCQCGSWCCLCFANASKCCSEAAHGFFFQVPLLTPSLFFAHGATNVACGVFPLLSLVLALPYYASWSFIEGSIFLHL
jgi:hypothetical protein